VRKKDMIFWGATSIFVISIIITAFTQNQLWLFLLLGSYLLRPTLASLGLARRLVDERQMSIQYRSGNIGFVVMIITSIIVAVHLSMQNNHAWEMFNIVIVLGVAGKALANVFLTGNLRDAGTKIIIAAGLLMFLFAAMENGLSLGTLMEGAPGLTVAFIGWLARIFPKTIGAVIFVVTAVLEYLILRRGFTLAQTATALLVGVPMITAGVCLILGDRAEVEKEAKTAMAGN
jgi:hypothetical protein